MVDGRNSTRPQDTVRALLAFNCFAPLPWGRRSPDTDWSTRVTSGGAFGQVVGFTFWFNVPEAILAAVVDGVDLEPSVAALAVSAFDAISQIPFADLAGFVFDHPCERRSRHRVGVDGDCGAATKPDLDHTIEADPAAPIIALTRHPVGRTTRAIIRCTSAS